MDEEFKPQRLACSHGPDLHFSGKLCGSYSTQNRAGTKDRWTELRLWETPAGNWIAESVGMSTRGNEGEIREARVIEPCISIEPGPPGLAEAIRTEITAPMRQAIAERGVDAGFTDDWPPSEHRIAQAMDLWQWTTAAKAFARELGWQVVRHVE